MATAMRNDMEGMGEMRCTQCGAGIDMARASEHVCRSATPASAPMNPMARFNNALANMRVKTNAPFPFDARPGPSLPARNDPIAARRMEEAREQEGSSPSTTVPSRNSPPPMGNASSRQPQPAPFRMPPRQMTQPEITQRTRPWDMPPPDRAQRDFPPRGASSQQSGLLQRPPPEKASPMPLDASYSGPARPPRSVTPGAQHHPIRAKTEQPPSHLGLPQELLSRPNIERSATATPTMSGRQGPHPPPPTNFTEREPFAGPSAQMPAAPWDTGYRAGESVDIRSASPLPRHNRDEVKSPDSVMTVRPPRLDSAMAGDEATPSVSTTQSLSRSPEPSTEQSQQSSKLGHFRKPSMSAAIRPLHEIGSVRSHRPTLSRSGSVPPRSVEDRSDVRLQDAPPVPTAPFMHDGEDIQRSRSAPGTRDGEFAGVQPSPLFQQVRQQLDEDLFHSPTQSISSNGSMDNTVSSRSSPPTSAASLAPYRDQHELVDPRLAGDSLHSSYKARAPAPLKITSDIQDLVPPPLSARSAPHHDRELPYSPPYNLPPMTAPLKQNFDEPPRSPKLYGHNASESRSEEAPAPAPRRRPVQSFSRPRYSPPVDAEPESPMDPDMHFNRLPAINTRGPPPPPMPLQSKQLDPAGHPPRMDMPGIRPPMPSQQRQWDAPPPTPREVTPGTPGLPRPQFPPRGESRSQPASPPRPTRQPSRHTCRGCNELIRGKSVSSADGRLSGRWHRECFVCRTCSAPFATQDFYVFGNQPYCAHHYHALNRTLCSGCSMGIEGSYIETDRRLKFHPDCFCCVECAGSLDSTHFEDPASGHILCERCAFETSMRPGVHGQRSYPERRTTRMMNVF